MTTAEIAGKLGEQEIKIKSKNIDWASDVLRNGVIIALHIGRSRFERKITKDDLGININDADFQKVLSEYYMLGSKLLVPKKAMQVFERLESRGRNNLYLHSFDTPWGRFVPYTAYQSWKEDNEKHKEEYMKEADLLAENLCVLNGETLAGYRTAAETFHERTDKSVPLNVFVESFIENIKKQLPVKNDVQYTFYYKEDIYYIPLPSAVEEENLKAAVLKKERLAEDAKTEVELKKIRMEVQMHRDCVEKMMQSKKEKVDGVLDSISKELKGAIFETLKDVLEGLKDKKTLPVPTVKRMRGFVERTRMMNFLLDADVEAALLEIEAMIESKSGDVSLNDLAQGFHGIASEFEDYALGGGRLPMPRDIGLLL